MKRFVRVVAMLATMWLVLVFVLGFVFAGRTGDRVAKRIADSVQGTATIGDSSLGLVRGTFSAERLAVRRDDIVGKLSIDVGELHCDLAPLGLALVDRSCGDLEIKDVKLTLSTLALFQLQRPKRTSLTAERVVIDNADFTFSPTAVLPSLGSVHIVLEHVEAGPTKFKTPLSFVFALEAMRAKIDLPAGITLRLSYADGKLTAAGTIFGSTPVEVPIALPTLESTDDAQAEMRKLVAFGKDLAEKLVAQKAEDWLLKKLPLP